MRLIAMGGVGFIGSTVVCHVIRGSHDVLTIDNLTYAGRREPLSDIIASPRPPFAPAGIADSGAIESAIDSLEPDALIHLAAGSHVDRSIDDSSAFAATNVADPGHDLRYAADPSHAEPALARQAAARFDAGLVQTIGRYLANTDWLIPPSDLGRLGVRSLANAVALA